jgi:hypothetical protein
MKQTVPFLVVSVLVAAILVAACGGSSAESPPTGPLDLSAVTNALSGAGIEVVDVADNLNPRDGAWQCVPGSFRLARVSQQPVAAIAHPGDGPAVEILLFSSDAERTAAQAAIGADGQVKAQGCGMMVDWVATPHVIGVRNVLLFVATDDAATVGALQAAAARLAD